jgi:hypothetical protein
LRRISPSESNETGPGDTVLVVGQQVGRDRPDGQYQLAAARGVDNGRPWQASR